MANNWRLLKTNEDVKEALDYTFDNNEPIEILSWDEQTKLAHVSEVDVNTRCWGTEIGHALAWRPTEDEEEFKKFLAKLDGDYDAYVLEFSAQVTSEQHHAIAENIRDSLESELPFKGADYFVFEIIGYVCRVIILVDSTMNFDIPVARDIPVGSVTHIQKTTPSYAAHDHRTFAKCLKEQRRQLTTRFFGADVGTHYCGYDVDATKRLFKFFGDEEND